MERRAERRTSIRDRHQARYSGGYRLALNKLCVEPYLWGKEKLKAAYDSLPSGKVTVDCCVLCSCMLIWACKQ